MMKNPSDIPVCRPLLPNATTLTPYLSRIDAARYYSNFGPLVSELESRLAAHIGLPHTDYLSTFSSGMSALSLAVKALKPLGKYGLVPAWTFIATPLAITDNAMLPYFTDVDAESWALTPAIAEAVIKDIGAEHIGVIIPVAPFGIMPDFDGWAVLSARYNIPVVIDGATLSLDDIPARPTVPVMVSLHATKMLGAAEGGLLIANDADLISKTRALSNFGIHGGHITDAGQNAKMSEYHAAIALASFDDWAVIKADFLRVALRYASNLNGADGLSLLPGYGVNRANSTCIIRGPALHLAKLNQAGIETRQWWKEGCHRQPLFADAPHADLTNSEYAAAHSTGLPCWRDLADEQIDQICDILLNTRKEHAHG